MYLEYFLQEVFANVCKRLQTFLIRIQDSRFKIPRKTSWIQGDRIQDSRFKIPRKTSWIQGDRIQDSRFPEKLLESQDSRFKIPRKNSWIQGDRSWILNPGIQEVFLGILNLESWILGFKNSFWESWILNPIPLDSRSFSGNLESWILNPAPLGFKNSFWESWILNPGIQEFFLGILNLESYPLGFKNSFWGSWILNLSKYLGPWTRLQTFANAFGDKITLSTWVQQ